jgi:DNA-binding MarR family transcriptional regulator
MFLLVSVGVQRGPNIVASATLYQGGCIVNDLLGIIRTMTTPRIARALSPRDPRIATWRDFLIAHARLERLLDEDLRSEHDLSLAEYDALLQLAEAPGRRLRMHQLADQVLLSRSGVTRLIDRLVADGSVERDSCLTDARGAEAVLTAAGLDRLRDAAPTHLRGIAQHFLGSIAPADLSAVARAMRDVVAGLETEVPLEDRRTGS